MNSLNSPSFQVFGVNFSAIYRAIRVNNVRLTFAGTQESDGERQTSAQMRSGNS